MVQISQTFSINDKEDDFQELDDEKSDGLEVQPKVRNAILAYRSSKKKQFRKSK